MDYSSPLFVHCTAFEDDFDCTGLADKERLSDSLGGTDWIRLSCKGCDVFAPLPNNEHQHFLCSCLHNRILMHHHYQVSCKMSGKIMMNVYMLIS